jgi:hypothetical protein
MKKLQFGYGDGVPEGARAAWGARAIVNSHYLDVPPDRISFAGEPGPTELTALIEKLKSVGPISLAEAKLAEGLRPSDDPVEIYEDAEFKVVGRLFGGYFYLAAYLKPEEPGILLPRKPTGPDIGSLASGPIWLKLIRKVLASEDGDVFKLLTVGPGEDGQYREFYEGADIVFPSYDEDIVRVVPKSPEAEAVIVKALEELKEKV